MTGLSEIAVIDENSTLFEAVLEIDMARTRTPDGMRCPAAVVVDQERKVGGFLEFRNLLRGLERRLDEFVESAKKGDSPLIRSGRNWKNTVFGMTPSMVCATRPGRY